MIPILIQSIVKNITLEKVLKVLAVLVVIAAIVVLFVMMSGKDSSIDKAIDLEIKRIEGVIKKSNARTKELENEIRELKDEIKTIRNDMAQSAERREELKDALKDADSIDAIDRILRSGIGR